MTELAKLLRKATARASGPWNQPQGPRVGVMLHYTAGTDLSGLQWLLFDPACKVSYNWLVLDDGTTVSVAPKEARAYHAGKCKRSRFAPQYVDANSAFYGIAVAAQKGDVATDRQMGMVVALIVGLFIEHGWTADDVHTRITDHAAEAWPRGRKVDTGTVLPLHEVRALVRKTLLEP